jgi:hypothetical protein
VLVVSQMTYRDRIDKTPIARRTSMTTGTHLGLS